MKIKLHNVCWFTVYFWKAREID